METRVERRQVLTEEWTSGRVRGLISSPFRPRRDTGVLGRDQRVTGIVVPASKSR